MKKFINIVLIVIIVLFIIFIIQSKLVNKNIITKIFGFGILYVTSGSMYPTIETGELIFIKERQNYNVNDIVTYNVDNMYLVTHRIVEKEADKYITKGDYNNVVDEEKVTHKDIEGKVVMHSKILGNIFKFKYIIIVLIILLSIIGITTAKYSQVIKSNISCSIAKPIVEVKGEETLNITLANKKISYAFEVINYNENEELNEVDLEYEISIMPNNKNIKYNLYYEGKEIELKDCKTQKIQLGREQKEEHQYELDIEYIGEQEDINEEVQIKVKFVQKI